MYQNHEIIKLKSLDVTVNNYMDSILTKRRSGSLEYELIIVFRIILWQSTVQGLTEGTDVHLRK